MIAYLAKLAYENAKKQAYKKLAENSETIKSDNRTKDNSTNQIQINDD